MSDLESLAIIDPHHHLWDLETNRYPWLSERTETRVCGEYSAIRKNYLLEDFRRDVGPLKLVKSVHVQAEHDHSDPVRETRWLQAVADRPDSGGIPHGIVAYADLGAPDAERVLDEHAAFANLRGIRQMLHEGLVDPANPRPSPLDDTRWQAGVGLLAARSLSFDLQIYPQQAEAAFELVARYPNIQFVLTHTGQPARQDPEGRKRWKDAMRRLAEAENLAVKISGFGMFDRRWTIDSIRPFVLDTIGYFGPERCMFASNFPVDSMASSYARVWESYSAVTAGFSLDERQALFAANAERIYRLKEPRATSER